MATGYIVDPAGAARMRWLNRSIAASRPRKCKKRPLTHGNLYDYNRGCRCALCVEARRRYCREWRHRKRVYPKHRHGLNATYVSGCRCELCKQAHAEDAASYRGQGGLAA